MCAPYGCKGGGWGGAKAVPNRTQWSFGQPTEDINVREAISLVSPQAIKEDLPMTAASNCTIVESRETIKRIITGQDSRLLVVVGPCSVHDEQAALDYARRLRELKRHVDKHLYVVMRVYFEKPRTAIGWKGLINDPHLDGTFDIETGIRRARSLLLQISQMGLPTATEVLDPITPAYLADLVTWGAIGARTIESQTHRELASGLSMPIGYKNGTGGDLQIAIDAMRSSQSPHSFLGVDEEGRTSVIRTRGNRWGHLILRGGRDAPNYDADSVASAVDAMRAAKLTAAIMVDCSHANSNKQYERQGDVWMDVIRQRLAGQSSLIGMMLESNINPGKQDFHQPAQPVHAAGTPDHMARSQSHEQDRTTAQQSHCPAQPVHAAGTPDHMARSQSHEQDRTTAQQSHCPAQPVHAAGTIPDTAGKSASETNRSKGAAVRSPLDSLEYGVSITDGCIGWEQTEQLMREAVRMMG